MFVLKDTKCTRCGGYIEPIPYKDTDELTGEPTRIVSHAECIKCGKSLVLSLDDYNTFVIDNCERVDLEY